MKKKILHSNVSGSGDTIVLLHGYLSSSQYFSRMEKKLAKTHHVISLDLLGFGKSPKPRLEYSYEQQVDAIAETLKELSIKKPFVLIGHSMGALIAARYAVKSSSDILSLQLFNPPMYRDNEQAMNTLKTTGRRYRAMIASPLRPVYWQALKLVPRRRADSRHPINFTDTVRMSRHAREGMMHNVIAAPRFFDDIEKLVMPTLLVVGKYDRVVYQENLRSITLPKQITLKILETGHHPIVKNSDLAENLIREYL